MAARVARLKRRLAVALPFALPRDRGMLSCLLSPVIGITPFASDHPPNLGAPFDWLICVGIYDSHVKRVRVALDESCSFNAWLDTIGKECSMNKNFTAFQAAIAFPVTPRNVVLHLNNSRSSLVNAVDVDGQKSVVETKRVVIGDRRRGLCGQLGKELCPKSQIVSLECCLLVFEKLYSRVDAPCRLDRVN
jgi:hypothetical protein